MRQFWNITSGIYAKYHVQIMLSFVYTTTRKRFVIFTCRYFKLSWNTTALSQSNWRNFSCSSIRIVIAFLWSNVAQTTIRTKSVCGAAQLYQLPGKVYTRQFCFFSWHWQVFIFSWRENALIFCETKSTITWLQTLCQLLLRTMITSGDINLGRNWKLMSLVLTPTTWGTL